MVDVLPHPRQDFRKGLIVRCALIALLCLFGYDAHAADSVRQVPPLLQITSKNEVDDDSDLHDGDTDEEERELEQLMTSFDDEDDPELMSLDIEAEDTLDEPAEVDTHSPLPEKAMCVSGVSEAFIAESAPKQLLEETRLKKPALLIGNAEASFGETASNAIAAKALAEIYQNNPSNCLGLASEAVQQLVELVKPVQVVPEVIVSGSAATTLGEVIYSADPEELLADMVPTAAQQTVEPVQPLEMATEVIVSGSATADLGEAGHGIITAEALAHVTAETIQEPASSNEEAASPSETTEIAALTETQIVPEGVQEPIESQESQLVVELEAADIGAPVPAPESLRLLVGLAQGEIGDAAIIAPSVMAQQASEQQPSDVKDTEVAEVAELSPQKLPIHLPIISAYCDVEIGEILATPDHPSLAQATPSLAPIVDKEELVCGEGVLKSQAGMESTLSAATRRETLLLLEGATAHSPSIVDKCVAIGTMPVMCAEQDPANCIAPCQVAQAARQSQRLKPAVDHVPDPLLAGVASNISGKAQGVALAQHRGMARNLPAAGSATLAGAKSEMQPNSFTDHLHVDQLVADAQLVMPPSNVPPSETGAQIESDSLVNPIGREVPSVVTPVPVQVPTPVPTSTPVVPPVVVPVHSDPLVNPIGKELPPVITPVPVPVPVAPASTPAAPPTTVPQEVVVPVQVVVPPAPSAASVPAVTPASPPAQIPEPVPVPIPTTTAPAPVPTVTPTQAPTTPEAPANPPSTAPIPIPPPTVTPESATGASGETQRPGFLINFNNVLITEYIRFISKITSRNFIFNENDLNFGVTIISEEPATIENIMTALLQELRIHGLSLMEQGNNIIIHRNPEVKSPSTVVLEGSEGAAEQAKGSELITSVFRLNTVPAKQMSVIVAPLLSNQAIVEATADGGHLVVTDLKANIDKIADLIRNLDAPMGGLLIGQYVVHNTSIEALINVVKKILSPIAQGKILEFVPHPPSNSVYVISSPYLVQHTIAMLQHLDFNGGATGILSMEQLSHMNQEQIEQMTAAMATARISEEEAAELERRRLAGQVGSVTGVTPGTFVPGAVVPVIDSPSLVGSYPRWSPELPPGHIENTQFYIHKLQFRKGDQITAALRRIAESLQLNPGSNVDLITTINSIQWLEAPNSLVMTGTPVALEKIRELIAEVDVPLRQVFVEMLILDTNIEDSLTYGVDVGSRFGGPTSAGSQAFLNSPSALPGALNTAILPVSMGGGGVNVLDPSVILPASTTGGVDGFGIGVIGRTIFHGNQSFASLGALVRSLHVDNTVDILLNPKLLVEDNTSAEIFVGLNTPFQTQTIVNNLGQILTSNFEYRDVGTRFKVTPQLGNSDIITLIIEEEVSTIDPLIVTANAGPTTRKSNSSTRVHIPNEYFLIMSGIIEDEEDRRVSQMPCLGGIPILGAAVKNYQFHNRKRNLLIFLRPRIIDTEEEIDDITKRQQDIYIERSRHRNRWTEEIDAGLDFLNLTCEER